MAIPTWWARLTRRRLHLDEADFEDEIRSHLALAADDRVADGADRTAARQAALREFGNVTLTTEAARRVWTPRWLDALRDLLRDARYALRALATHPAFALTVVGVLALGIGLNAVVFTMLKGLALSPLAGVAGSGRVVVVYGETNAGHQVPVSYPDYLELRAHDGAFADLMGSRLITAAVGRGRASRSVWGELVTGNYFQVLGVRAELGRTLLPSDDIASGGRPVVVLSDGLWRSDFGADSGIVGRTVEINHRVLTVTGVADAHFHGTIVGYDVELFSPVAIGPVLGVTFGSNAATPAAILADRSAAVLFPQGHLASGTSLASANEQTEATWARLARARPLAVPVAEHLRVVRFAQSPTGGQTYLLPSLMVLSAMGLLVLLITCANIAGLVIVRGLSRRGEIALRLALGATRTRIVRLLVVENFVLAVPAAILGVGLASRGIPLFITYAQSLAAPERLFFNMDVDGLVIGFAVVLGCACALVFGFVPALRSARVDLVSVMNESAPRGSARGGLRAALVVAQVAVSVLLLVGAGLVRRSLEAARAADPGFDAGHVAVVAVDVGRNAYSESQGRAFYHHLLDAARADPGVDSATLAALNPLALIDTRLQRVEIEGYAPRQHEDLAFMYNTVAPDYFRTLRITLASGRDFTVHDDEAGAPVAIVNTTFADRYAGGTAEAIGRRIRVAGTAWRTIVGVAADIKYLRINEAPRPYVYLPFWQSYQPFMLLQTRGPAPVDELVARARTDVTALDPDLPVESAKPLAEWITGALFFFTLTATVLSIFGVAGMALAALGTYGLVSYAVRQRTLEIGIRMALGAPRFSVVRDCLGGGVRLGLAGAAIGLGGAFGVSLLLRSALYGVGPTDLVSFARALAVVLGGVVIATIVPAWRASRTDPVRALRQR